jgi:hypothetical protein
MNTTFALDYAKPDGLFCTGWQSASEEIIGPMYRGRTVGQEFVAAHNDLCAVGVAFATYGKKCQGMVRFRLRTAGWAGEEQATVETDAAAITDNELYIFSFDPIPDSAGQRFSFSVDFVPATDKSELTIYKSSNTDERFGPYMERDIPATGTLTFRWFTPARLRTAPLGQMPALSSALA